MPGVFRLKVRVLLRGHGYREGFVNRGGNGLLECLCMFDGVRFAGR